MIKEDGKIKMILPAVEPPRELLGRVFRAVEEAQLRRARLKVAGFSVVFATAVAVFGFAIGPFVSGLSQTGFAEYLSLLFTDTSLLSAYLGDYLLSLLETLPALPLAALFGSVLVLLESAKYLSEGIVSLRRGLKFNF